jgi:pyruvate/2-oxoglutarate dehydrogenase complex dihydrolipoamide dehydrogenase (E3) component
MRRFGSDVTIVERNGHLAHREDEDVTQALEELFRDEGIAVATNTKINRVEGSQVNGSNSIARGMA